MVHLFVQKIVPNIYSVNLITARAELNPFQFISVNKSSLYIITRLYITSCNRKVCILFFSMRNKISSLKLCLFYQEIQSINAFLTLFDVT